MAPQTERNFEIIERVRSMTSLHQCHRFQKGVIWPSVTARKAQVVPSVGSRGGNTGDKTQKMCETILKQSLS